MKFLRLFFILLFFNSVITVAQNQEKEKQDQVYPQDSEDKVTIFKPTAGLGIGILSYFGDIGSASFKNPMTSRIGYQFLASTRLNSFIDLNFHALFGKIEANERSVERNLNFQSEIRTGGISISYNFHHILPKHRKLDPFISIGIESVEFLSKTDLFDEQGNQYNYWSDGSIRSKPENDIDAESAIYLQRDYIFETDIRESNTDGFGKYAERTFAIPAGIGVRMYLNDNLDFKIGTTFHYTFSNMIDGISENSVGNRVGNSQNDHFLYSSFSLNYRFTVTKKVKKKDIEKIYSDVDYTALDLEDEDQDGVKDFVDKCPETPTGVKVDKNGCPLDSDSDGVPDYLDLEANTAQNVFVDKDGVALTDEAILLLYETYMDSTGKFAIITKTRYEAEMQASKSEQYRVQLGSYTKGIPPELINKFLSFKDVTSTEVNSAVTVYSVGNYNNYNEALKRKNELLNSGLNDATVVLVRNGKFIPEGDPRFTIDSKLNSSTNTLADNKSGNKTNNTSNTSENNNSFEGSNKDKENVKVSETGAGSNSNNENRTETGVGSNSNNDNRTETGVGSNSNNDNSTKTNPGKNNETNNTTTTNLITTNTNTLSNKNNTSVKDIKESKDPKDVVVFRIQLGAYSRKLSKNIFENIDDITIVTNEDGLSRYLAGSYTDYNEAVKEKINFVLNGFNGSFIVAYKNGKRIPLSTVGATKAAPENLNDPVKPESAVSKELITFKVQIGAFKNEVPANIRIKYNSIKGLETQQTPSGLTRYISGSFNDYNKAVSLKNEMINTYGISDAFVIAYFKDQLIPVQEALELLK
ncbi:MAG: hypothetical protein M3Q58_16170 [Bacteroidota bacterium]|nr:hypothetical protein [Bacteroidota bacterium]